MTFSDPDYSLQSDPPMGHDMLDAEAEGRYCSICDGLGHGYPGGPPCPLEIADYSNEPWWAQ
jgi:hypothetical protein